MQSETYLYKVWYKKVWAHDKLTAGLLVSSGTLIKTAARIVPNTDDEVQSSISQLSLH